MSTIKINELADGSLALNTLSVFADQNGLAFKRNLSDFKDFLSTLDDTSFKGKLLIADTPVDGWYFAGESGTYTNAGDLVVDVSDNISIIIVSNSVTTFEKVDIPVTITIDAVPTDGSTNAVQSGGTFDAIKQPTIDYIKFGKYTTANKNLIDVSDTTKAYYIFDSTLAKWQQNIGNGWEDISSNVDLPAGLTYDKEVIKTLNLFDETVGSNVNYGQPSFVFIPNTNNTENGEITQIEANLTGSLVGRTIGLVLLTPTTGTSYITDYIGAEYPAEDAGYNAVTLPTPVPILSTQKFGILVRTSDTAKAISNLRNTGVSTAGYGGDVRSVTLLAIGEVDTWNTLNDDTLLRVRATITVTEENSLKVNVANGLLQLDENVKFSDNFISYEYDWFKGKKILYVGNSIAAGSDANNSSETSDDARYPDLIGKMLGCDVENVAIGGSRIIWDATNPSTQSLSATKAEMETAFPGNTLAPLNSYEEVIIGKDFEYIVIDHYANDRLQISQNNYDLGNIDSVDRAEYFGAWNYLIDKIYTYNPNAKIIIASTPNLYFDGNQNIYDAGIAAVNGNQTIAEKYNLPHANHARLGYVNTVNYLEFNADGTHPTDDLERLRRAFFLAQFIKRHP